MVFDGLKRYLGNISPYPLDVEPDTAIRNKSANYQMATDSVKVRI